MATSPKPVTRSRRLALDAVMEWVRDRERGGASVLGPEREYVEGITGKTTISGAGKVYASEAVDRFEAFAETFAARETELRDTLTWLVDMVDTFNAGAGPETVPADGLAKARALVDRLPKGG